MAPAIPKDSLVLVTGVNGYIGSHIADQLLEAGYRVRGATRSLEKVKALSALWDQKYGPGKVEFIVVSDMSHAGAFDEAVKGVAGIAHVASDVSLGADPNKVITPVLDGVNGILKSAANELSVKRFVYTSSSTAASAPKPNKVLTIDANTWNEEDIKAAHAPPPYTADRAWAVYGASKTEGEQAVWKFVQEQKPDFVANTILPNLNIGKILVKGQPASTGGWVVNLYNGNAKQFEGFPPQWFVDVQDCARLHVAALIDPDVKNERLFAYAETFNANDLLKIFRKLQPGKQFPADYADNSRDLSIVKNERSIELLEKDFGRPGWTTLEESIKNCIQDL
ncbi:NAD(P)-binding protein [Acephala macrosclerotiorum]|nr:NAD(P)-binding protein [Acephala macrosclerotiorum]